MKDISSLTSILCILAACGSVISVFFVISSSRKKEKERNSKKLWPCKECKTRFVCKKLCSEAVTDTDDLTEFILIHECPDCGCNYFKTKVIKYMTSILTCTDCSHKFKLYFPNSVERIEPK